MEIGTLVSADSHLVEPPDIFETRLDASMRPRAPRMELTIDANGRSQHVWTLDGQMLTPPGGGAPLRGARSPGTVAPLRCGRLYAIAVGLARIDGLHGPPCGG